MTAGELRMKLVGVDDETPVLVSLEDKYGGGPTILRSPKFHFDNALETGYGDYRYDPEEGATEGSFEVLVL